MLRRVLIVAAFGLFGAPVAPARAGELPAGKLRVGTKVLRACGVGGWCGTVSRPLDPARPAGRRIEIAFKWFDGGGSKPLRPPLVAVEGGPGYPSNGSRIEYRGIYGLGLLRERSLLLVDNRGTGRSALIDCKSVQSVAGRTSGRAFARRAGRCAREIDARYGRGASGLFATAYASDDLAAVLRALQVKKVDLPPLHTPGYPSTPAAAALATLVSGPDPGETARRAATVAAQALADATMRLVYSEGARFGPGLRGGRFVARGEQLTLERVRFVDDAEVSGTGTFKASTGAVDAVLTVAGVPVHVTWTHATPLATATVGGAVLSLPAP